LTKDRRTKMARFLSNAGYIFLGISIFLFIVAGFIVDL
jgi:hypothetical protein